MVCAVVFAMLGLVFGLGLVMVCAAVFAKLRKSFSKVPTNSLKQQLTSDIEVGLQVSGASTAGAAGRTKIAQMSAEVRDDNPYSRLMALKRMGVVENYEKIRSCSVIIVGVGGVVVDGVFISDLSNLVHVATPPSTRGSRRT